MEERRKKRRRRGDELDKYDADAWIYYLIDGFLIDRQIDLAGLTYRV